jgi:hypothetical protein
MSKGIILHLVFFLSFDVGRWMFDVGRSSFKFIQSYD